MNGGKAAIDQRDERRIRLLCRAPAPEHADPFAVLAIQEQI
ncbi:MAG: hypothetical protein WDO69_09150 [Pseudomonadota bacterium]